MRTSKRFPKRIVAMSATLILSGVLLAQVPAPPKPGTHQSRGRKPDESRGRTKAGDGRDVPRRLVGPCLRSPRLAAEAFMDQHFEQGLVSHTFAGRDLSRLRHVGFRQSQRDLNAGSPVQSADKARSLRRAPLPKGFGRSPLYKFAARATGPPVRLFAFIHKPRHVNRFFLHSFTPPVPGGPGSPSFARRPSRTQ